MRASSSFALIVLLCALPAAAEERQPVVVELYTSQGCNSCPPADAYLGELAGRHDLLPLAFHVDYWNYIGWTDPFAKPWATARQRGYLQSLSERFVYTPQIVVAGAAQGIGSDHDAIEGLIHDAVAHRAQPLDLELRWRADGALLVEVGAGESPAKSPADIWLIGYDKPHETEVLRGENAGRTAVDYQAVRSYRRIGAWPGWSLELVVPQNEVANLGTGGVVVLVQSAGQGPVIAARRIDPR
jgi:hypothetical protein